MTLRRPAATSSWTAGQVMPTPKNVVQTKQDLKKLETILQSLPTNQRSALLLCHYEGMSLKEAGGVLGISEKATKSLLHRARLAAAKGLLQRARHAV